MNPLFLLILLALLPSGIIDCLTAGGISVSQSSTFVNTIDLIMERTGTFGFAILCLLLYGLSSACLPVLTNHLLHLTGLQRLLGVIMSILGSQTFLTVLDFTVAVFIGFGFGFMIAYHNALVMRLLAKVHQSTKSSTKLAGSIACHQLRLFLKLSGYAWPVVDNVILFFGILWEASRLPEKVWSLVAFMLLTTIFTVSMCALALAATSFVAELGGFLLAELMKLWPSALSNLSAIAQDLYLIIYLSDGTINISIGDLPAPHDPTDLDITTAASVIRHIRTTSFSTNTSKATQGSSPSKISIQHSTVSKESQASSSLPFSGHSTDNSRPTSRSSHPTTVTDLDQSQHIVDSCMERIQALEVEYELLRKNNDYIRGIEQENEMLRVRDEHSRRDRFQDEQKLKGALKGIEFVEAANASLLAENLYLHQKLDEAEIDGNLRLMRFVRLFCPQHLDLFNDSEPSSSTPPSYLQLSPKEPTTPRRDRISLESTPIKPYLGLPDTPSSGPSLPMSPRTPVARSLGHISPTSLIKPLHPRTPTGPGLLTPEVMRRKFDITVKIVVPRCPTTVSSRNSLPCPTTIPSESSPALSIDKSATRSPIPSHSCLKKRSANGVPLFPAGPGLPCPMRQVFGDRIPYDSSPTAASDDTPLPCPTPISVPSKFGRVSVNSMNRPYFGCHVESPLANRGRNDTFSVLSSGNTRVDPFSSIEQPRYKTPAARARAQRFSKFLDHEYSLSYNSSTSSPLPASPRPSENSSDYDLFI